MQNINTPAENPVYVIGHKNPDTDSICSAICYAELKTKLTGRPHIAKRCGHTNPETAYVLSHFGIDKPEYVANVYTQVKDVEYRHLKGVSGELSIKNAWSILSSSDLSTLPIVDNGYLTGIITVNDIAKTCMEVYDNDIISKAKTPFSNLAETLNADFITGDPDKVISDGKLLVAAANPDLMEIYIEKNDIVILGNRYESQLCAIEMGAQCIIVCEGSPVSLTITKLAESKNCTILKTFYDAYTVSRLVNQSIPIRYFMKTDNIITFNEDDYIKDIRTVMAKKRLPYYPVLAEDGKLAGLISQRNYLNANPKNVILVDHNERSQAVDGIDEVNLLEIIDHHRLGGLQTMTPVYFRNMPLGCTATIIYSLYNEYQVEISKKIASLLLAAIISDTLMFRSPTCTATDREACTRLSEIAELDIETLANDMFREGCQLATQTEPEIFYQDNKLFAADDFKCIIAQVSAFNPDAIRNVKPKMLKYMREQKSALGADTLFLMLTDISCEATTLLFYSELEDFDEALAKAFNQSPNLIQDKDPEYPCSGSLYLPGVVSRKKQVAPVIISAAKEING